MKPLKIWLIIVFLVLGGAYVKKSHLLETLVFKPETWEIVSPVSANYVTPKERRDTTIAIIDQFLKKKKSPLFGLGSSFYDYGQQYGIDPFLLVAIAGTESSFGHRACNFNPFGWGSCQIVFKSFDESIRTVTYKLATLSAYENWRQDKKNIEKLAIVYNAGHQQKWKACVEYFIRELKFAGTK